jgi:hypothetical protein
MTAIAQRNPYHAEIASLRAQLEEAREELRQLHEILKPSILFPPEWRLTQTEREILLKPEPVTDRPFGVPL